MVRVEIPQAWNQAKAKADQVNDIKPVDIQAIADQFTNASKDSADHVAHLNSVSQPLVGLWKGPAADQFFAGVQEVVNAGKRFNDKLDDVAREFTQLQQDLNTVKGAIQSERSAAETEINSFVNTANNQTIPAAESAMAAHQRDPEKNKAPDPTPEAIAKDAQGKADARANVANTKIGNLVTQAEGFLTKAGNLARQKITGGYSSVKGPGGGGGGTRAARSSGGLHAGGGGGGGGGGGLGPSGGPPSTQPPGNVEGWIKEAIKILQANGIPVTDADIGKIWTIIEKESGGNPNAINNWDSNAAKGTPSKGLMQCIDPTFQAHKLPGHDDIYNPVDNIIAGVRYTFDRYGGFAGHPGLKSMAGGGGYQGY
ncbi:transglycosylase SLT domain-containing protein [Amycolatopsis anabasis]|uniref:transglycosylase SLT domain-containing protein n=1 Tax=Amycolatopsis anabasis TaxID=1840409 RepID=UPI00131AFE78|nr:transglycosylase SLT domain-containing protein [Amycolatopsis anabasis]